MSINGLRTSQRITNQAEEMGSLNDELECQLVDEND